MYEIERITIAVSELMNASYAEVYEMVQRNPKRFDCALKGIDYDNL
jgi:hypothetical protein